MRQSPSLACSASSVNTTAHSLSDRLNRAEDVDHPASLEARLAPEVGGRIAQDLFHPPGLSDQLAMAADEERRRAADVRRRHAGAVHGLVIAIQRARIDPLAGRDEVRLGAP